LDSLLNWTQTVGNLWVIISLKSAPGCQNAVDLYCGSNANLWTDSDNQQGTVALWQRIARRYVNNTIIAGYNLLAAPAAPTNSDLQTMYQQIIAAIRTEDPNHILFVEGNNLGVDFSVFTSRWVLSTDNNTAYALQVYDSFNCPVLNDYQSDITSDLLMPAMKAVQQDNLPIFISEYGGECASWLQAMIASIQNQPIFQPTAYFTYKGETFGKGLNLYEMSDSSAWDSLCNKLVLNTFATDDEWTNGLDDWKYSNFKEKTDFTAVIRDYFSGRSVSYTYSWWILAVIIIGGVLVAVAVIIFGVVMYKRKQKHYLYS